ncbi:hypothetical protein NPIL_99751 [Nephila pilipes]|uniref:Uncharacterized protein n=1 Tax=Nephila pilipes TaxID=299642 RepID=A0A8X6PYL6_NEPPI|nr:hypothetical protein NPIL_99751 [Nephila pilipes]
MNSARLHLSKSERKETFNDEHVVELEAHSLVGVFQSSIGISHKGLRNFLPLDGIGIKAILDLGLMDRTFNCLINVFFETRWWGQKREVKQDCFGFVISNEGFLPPALAGPMIGLVSRTDVLSRLKEQLGRHPLCLRAEERLDEKVSEPYISSCTDGAELASTLLTCDNADDGERCRSVPERSLASPANDDIRCDCSTIRSCLFPMADVMRVRRFQDRMRYFESLKLF